MLTSNIFTLFAVGASMVAAQSYSAEETYGTTTSTSTMTATVTITRCNPSMTNCPAYHTSSSTYYPLSNSTTYVGPTAYPNSTATYATSAPSVYTSTSVVGVTPTYPTSSPSTVPTSGAGGVLVQSGLLLGVLAAGVALLA